MTRDLDSLFAIRTAAGESAFLYQPVILTEKSIFCHVRELPGLKSLVAGSKVSFCYEPDEKGGKAKEVFVEEAVEEVEQVREVGPIRPRAQRS